MESTPFVSPFVAALLALLIALCVPLARCVARRSRSALAWNFRVSSRSRTILIAFNYVVSLLIFAYAFLTYGTLIDSADAARRPSQSLNISRVQETERDEAEFQAPAVSTEETLDLPDDLVLETETDYRGTAEGKIVFIPFAGTVSLDARASTY